MIYWMKTIMFLVEEWCQSNGQHQRYNASDTVIIVNHKKYFIGYPLQEVLHCQYSTASDVWSFGCVMYEIWSLGHKPFESYNNAEVQIRDAGSH